jgi:hypothetical protein
MPGQPQLPGWIVFDVTNLDVTAEPSPLPTNIVKKDAPFDLTATFNGAGGIWNILELISDLPNIEVVGMVTFSAEGIGADAVEEDFGPEDVILNAASGGSYEVTTTVPANVLDKGVYIIACFAEFEVRAPGGDPIPLPGLIGHCEGLGPNKERLSAY